MGTQGTKALVWEAETGEVVGRGSYAYGLTSKRPGQAEQDPATWLQARGGVAGFVGGGPRPPCSPTAPPLPPLPGCCCCREAALAAPVLFTSAAIVARRPRTPPPPPQQACKESIRDALDDASSNGDAVDSRRGRGAVAQRVAALGVAGQQHGLVALDAEFKVIRPGGALLLRLPGLRGG